MAKQHLSTDGSLRRCRAGEHGHHRACPYGGHDTPEVKEAQASRPPKEAPSAEEHPWAWNANTDPNWDWGQDSPRREEGMSGQEWEFHQSSWRKQREERREEHRRKVHADHNKQRRQEEKQQWESFTPQDKQVADHLVIALKVAKARADYQQIENTRAFVARLKEQETASKLRAELQRREQEALKNKKPEEAARYNALAKSLTEKQLEALFTRAQARTARVVKKSVAKQVKPLPYPLRAVPQAVLETGKISISFIKWLADFLFEAYKHHE